MSEDTIRNRGEQLDKAAAEMQQFAARLREKYDIEAVVVLACTHIPADDQTEGIAARSGNYFASCHMARLFSENRFPKNMSEAIG